MNKDEESDFIRTSFENIVHFVGLMPPPHEPNLEIHFGESPGGMTVCLVETKSFLKQLKWHIFCMVFPAKIIRFEEEKKT